MKNFFSRLSERFRIFMYGRYGVDPLSNFLSKAGLVMLFLSLIKPLSFLYIFALATELWAIFRSLSKNHEKRSREYQVYLEYEAKVKKHFRLRKRMWTERKEFRYFKCPGCKIHLRVPKGKGSITITCPHCKKEITRKT